MAFTGRDSFREDNEEIYSDLLASLDLIGSHLKLLQHPPAGGLLFTCNGRGERLYKQPDGDVSVLREAVGDVEMAGFFAAGEIGPVGNRTFLHGFTSSLALFRGA